MALWMATSQDAMTACQVAAITDSWSVPQMVLQTATPTEATATWEKAAWLHNVEHYQDTNLRGDDLESGLEWVMADPLATRDGMEPPFFQAIQTNNTKGMNNRVPAGTQMGTQMMLLTSTPKEVMRVCQMAQVMDPWTVLDLTLWMATPKDTMTAC